MPTAQEFMAELQRAIHAEESAPRELSEAEAGLIGTWHWAGQTCLSLPADGVDLGSSGVVTKYGMTFRVSEQMIRNSFDRHGVSDFVALLADENEQLSRYGEVVARRGPWPADVLPFRPGSHEAAEAAASAKRAAWFIVDADERTAELSRLRKLFGSDWFGPESRSRTLADDLGGSGRDGLRPPDAR